MLLTDDNRVEDRRELIGHRLRRVLWRMDRPPRDDVGVAYSSFGRTWNVGQGNESILCRDGERAQPAFTKRPSGLNWIEMRKCQTAGVKISQHRAGVSIFDLDGLQLEPGLVELAGRNTRVRYGAVERLVAPLL